jgi:glycosyltransferase involved in cell wall biosynthesis
VPEAGVFVKNEVEALRALGLTVHVIAEPDSPLLIAYGCLWLRMRRLLASRKIDLVHAHYGLVGWIARLQRMAPVVVTFHGSDLLGTRDMRDGRPGAAGRIEQISSRILSRLIELPVIVSPRMVPLVPSRARCIPAGVGSDFGPDLDRGVARAELGLGPETRIVLFAANPARRLKRFSLAQAAVAALDDLADPVSLIALHAHSQRDVARWMTAADVLLLTSEQEGSPVAVREALACGLPVVSVDVGDVRERIAGVEHCAVCASDPVPLADAMRPVLRARPRVEAPANRIWTAAEAALALSEAYARLAEPAPKSWRPLTSNSS